MTAPGRGGRGIIVLATIAAAAILWAFRVIAALTAAPYASKGLTTGSRAIERVGNLVVVVVVPFAAVCVEEGGAVGMPVGLSGLFMKYGYILSAGLVIVTSLGKKE